jgi:hypothetical protein
MSVCCGEATAAWEWLVLIIWIPKIKTLNFPKIKDT